MPANCIAGMELGVTPLLQQPYNARAFEQDEEPYEQRHRSLQPRRV